MINLISCVVQYKNKLAIGRNGSLLIELKEDLKYFKKLTSECLSTDSKLDYNVVIMGRKTWYSIPKEYRPLKNRINIILTNDQDLLSEKNNVFKNKKTKQYDDTESFYMNFKQFTEFYKLYNPNVFVIGGGEIYDLFLKNSEFKPNNIYLTEVKGVKFTPENEPTIFMTHLDQEYRLISVGEKKKQCGISFRFLRFSH